MKYKAFIATVILSLLCFLFGNSMTPAPGTSSGNGNPAILLFLPLFIIFVILIIQWFKLLKSITIRINTLISILLLAICHLIIGIYYQITSLQRYRMLLAEVYEGLFGEIDWYHIHSITSGLSIHLNNQFFNINTWLLYINLSFLVWLLCQLIIAWRKK